MSDNPSFEVDSPDHFTAGAVGPPGQRVFYLQSRDGNRLITLKVEKEHVRALAEYVGGLLARVKGAPGAARGGAELIEPLEVAWDVGSLAVGYDDASQTFLVRNSWGAGWGMAGYFTMPYTYLIQPGLADDLWTIRIVGA